MQTINMTVMKSDGLWCVQIEREDEIQQLGRTESKDEIIEYLRVLSARIRATGDRPVAQKCGPVRSNSWV